MCVYVCVAVWSCAGKNRVCTEFVQENPHHPAVHEFYHAQQCPRQYGIQNTVSN